MEELTKSRALFIGGDLSVEHEAKQLLEDRGYRVSSAAVGSDGLELFRIERPELILVQVEASNPEAGFDLIQELGMGSPVCAVVCVTSTGSLELAVAALRAGACDYLRRPIQADRLREALDRMNHRQSRWRSLARTTILVMEDHDATRARLANVLQKEGYDVVVAANGAEGLQLLDARRIDIIVADVRMPEKDGLTVLTEVQTRERDVELILATAYGDHDVVVRALRDRAANFLRKPIDIDDLLAAVRRAIDRQTSCRAWASRQRGTALLAQLSQEADAALDASALALPLGASFYLRELVAGLPFESVVVRSDRSVVAPPAAISFEGPDAFGAKWLAILGVPGAVDESFWSRLDEVLAGDSTGPTVLELDGGVYLLVVPLLAMHDHPNERLFAISLCRNVPPANG